LICLRVFIEKVFLVKSEKRKTLGSQWRKLAEVPVFVVVEFTFSQIKLGGLLREFPVYSENEA